MPVTAAELDELFRAAFPARGGVSSLEYVETNARDGGGFGVVIRLVVWDRDHATGVESIRDVKEQEIWFNPFDSSRERIAAFLRAFMTLLPQALDGVPEIETYMPHDLMLWDVFKLKKAHTEEDFGKALLVGSRLGKFIRRAQAQAQQQS